MEDTLGDLGEDGDHGVQPLLIVQQHELQHPPYNTLTPANQGNFQEEDDFLMSSSIMCLICLLHGGPVDLKYFFYGYSIL